MENQTEALVQTDVSAAQHGEKEALNHNERHAPLSPKAAAVYLSLLNSAGVFQLFAILLAERERGLVQELLKLVPGAEGQTPGGGSVFERLNRMNFAEQLQFSSAVRKLLTAAAA